MDCLVYDLGLIGYREGLAIQKDLHKKRVLGFTPDVLLFCEHPSVITLGRSACKSNILADTLSLKKMGIEVFEADRGGDVTIHMPGQLVVYLIFNLVTFGKDVHLFLRMMEESVIVFLEGYGIKGSRIDKFTGVWVGNKKIAAIGIGISKWISYHGLSINIKPDLEMFSLIRPCGIEGRGIAGLSELLGVELQLQQVKDRFVKAAREVFGFSDMKNSVFTPLAVMPGQIKS